MKIPFVSFLPMEHELDKDLRAAFEELKAKWPDVYSGQKEATMVLNAGVHFNESCNVFSM